MLSAVKLKRRMSPESYRGPDHLVTGGLPGLRYRDVGAHRSSGRVCRPVATGVVRAACEFQGRAFRNRRHRRGAETHPGGRASALDRRRSGGSTTSGGAPRGRAVYCTAWEEGGLPASQARVALLAGEMALPEDIGAFEELADRVGSVDFVVPAIGAEGFCDERALEDFAAVFRRRFPQ